MSQADASRKGPWIGSASICERVIEEKDGVVSLIRMIDRVVQNAVGPEAPQEMPPFQLSGVSLVLLLIPGGAKGRHSVRVQTETPSGQLLPAVMDLPVLFEGEDRGVRLILNLSIAMEQEGLYWFDVFLDDESQLLTRVPLRVIYAPQRQTIG